jgi:solute carrier family 25 2-oxodicarboxylate transporter 21
MSHELSFLEHVIAGGGAGIVEILVMYPTDVLKTRFQLSTGKERPNLAATVRGMLKSDGVSIFYRGIVAPIFSEGPKRAVKFSTNEYYRKVFATKEGKLTFWRYFAAGASAGMTEAVVNCPFEVIKVRMQAPGSKELYKNTMDCAMKIVTQEGPLAVYKGFEPQLWRNAFWNGPYFAIGPVLKEKMGAKSKVSTAIAGMIAGAIATLFNTPLDVVKSRMQNQKLGQNKYNWAFPSLITLLREEGLTACYKGLGMRLLRLGPGGGIMLVTFDWISDMIREVKSKRKHINQP